MVFCLLQDSRKDGLNTTVNFMSGIMHDTSGLRALGNSKKIKTSHKNASLDILENVEL